jgi:hypothetical protein
VTAGQEREQQKRDHDTLEDLPPREDASAGLTGGEVHVSGGGKRNDIGPGMDD